MVKRRYSLSELIAKCDHTAPLSADLKAWEAATPCGTEVQSDHITPAGGNVFADLGFELEEAAALQTKSRKIISDKLRGKR